MTRISAHRVRRISGVVSTDDIIPARYKHMHTDPALLGPHLFEAFRPGFASTLVSGDVLVSDSVFGIGSSREQAVSTLLANGVAAVIAPAFGRILFRNCWNLALPAITAATANLDEEALVSIDLGAGEIARDGETLINFAAPSPFLLDMITAGGLLAQVDARLAAGE